MSSIVAQIVAKLCGWIGNNSKWREDRMSLSAGWHCADAVEVEPERGALFVEAAVAIGGILAVR